MGDGKPFDAGEAYWSEDLDGERSVWRTVSLVCALVTLISEVTIGAPPSTGRREAFVKAVEELTRRGIDGDSFVRYGLQNKIMGSLFGPLLIKLWVTEEDLGESASEIKAASDPWTEALLPPGDLEELTKEQKVAALADAVKVIECWIAAAPIAVLARLDPPEGPYECGSGNSITKGPVVEQYRWLADRFGATFLENWATESLHLEYRWMLGRGVGPCPEALMSDRSVEEHQLASEIARRVVFDRPAHLETEQLLNSDMRSYALSLLREGRCREAAALFEFALQRQPNDAAATNNLGFCLLTTEPQVALNHLVDAARLGYSPRSINVYNQLCCHLCLGDLRAALRVAEENWDHIEAEEARDSHLWHQQGDGEWSLHFTDARRELALLAGRVAVDAGLLVRAGQWQLRHDSLSSGASEAS